ncbi:MAG TPA: M48 family metalloprotease [Capsulimonadaceae bacterium]|jgi:heat shock protein HtpX
MKTPISGISRSSVSTPTESQCLRRQFVINLGIRYHIRVIALAALAAIGLGLCCSERSPAQSIVAAERGAFVGMRRAGDKAAKEEKFAQWPKVMDGERGTQVHITFDPSNVDVSLITALDYSERRLIDSSTKIARALKAPRATLRTLQGRKTSNVDIELNNYLTRHGSATAYALDFAALRRAIVESDLPTPIVFCIHADSIDASVMSQSLPPRHIADGVSLYSMADVKDWRALNLSVSMPPWAKPAAYLIVAIFVGMLAVVTILPWRVALKRKKEEPATSLNDAQAKYLKGRWSRLMGALVPLVVLAVFASQPFAHLPSYLAPVMWCLPAFLVSKYSLVASVIGGQALLLISTVGSRIYVNWATKRGRVPPPQETCNDLIDFGFFFWAGLALILGVTVLVSYLVPVPYRDALMPTVIPTFLTPIFFLSIGRKRQVLSIDDPLFKLCEEMGAKPGVNVKKVTVVKLPMANASVHPNGTINLTTGLVEKLTAEEQRAIVAHEIGHLQSGAMKKVQLAAVMTFLPIYIGTAGLIVMSSDRIPHPLHLPAWWWAVPFLAMFALFAVLSHYRKRDELVADAYAVEAIGDPDLYINAIVKIHALNQSPSKLTPEDEAFSTHPSLVKRIEAIRAKYPESTSGNADVMR